MGTEHTDRTMLGKTIKRGNFSLWMSGQITALFIGVAVSTQHDFSIGCAVGFAIMVLVDIRCQM